MRVVMMNKKNAIKTIIVVLAMLVLVLGGKEKVKAQEEESGESGFKKVSDTRYDEYKDGEIVGSLSKDEGVWSYGTKEKGDEFYTLDREKSIWLKCEESYYLVGTNGIVKRVYNTESEKCYDLKGNYSGYSEIKQGIRNVPDKESGKGKNYYFSKAGKRYGKSGWCKMSSTTNYSFGTNGEFKGKLVLNKNGTWSYYGYSGGKYSKLKSGWVKYSQRTQFYVNRYGVSTLKYDGIGEKCYRYVYVRKNKRYSATETVKSQLIKLSDGKIHYFLRDGSQQKLSGWCRINDNRYYRYEKGEYKEGLVRIKGRWIYHGADTKVSKSSAWVKQSYKKEIKLSDSYKNQGSTILYLTDKQGQVKGIYDESTYLRWENGKYSKANGVYDIKGTKHLFSKGIEVKNSAQVVKEDGKVYYIDNDGKAYDNAEIEVKGELSLTTYGENKTASLKPILSISGVETRYIYKSKDTDVVIVTSDGEVTIKGAGETKIEISDTTYGIMKTIDVTVKEPEISVGEEEIGLILGDEEKTVTATITAKPSETEGYKWSIGNESIAEVSESESNVVKITVKAVGETILKVEKEVEVEGTTYYLSKEIPVTVTCNHNWEEKISYTKKSIATQYTKKELLVDFCGNDCGFFIPLEEIESLAPDYITSPSDYASLMRTFHGMYTHGASIMGYTPHKNYDDYGLSWTTVDVTISDLKYSYTALPVVNQSYKCSICGEEKTEINEPAATCTHENREELPSDIASTITETKTTYHLVYVCPVDGCDYKTDDIEEIYKHVNNTEGNGCEYAHGVFYTYNETDVDNAETTDLVKITRCKDCGKLIYQCIMDNYETDTWEEMVTHLQTKGYKIK